MADVDVVVVGAGAAGIAAGRRLAAAGADFRVIEARDRLGGRGLTLVDRRAGPLDLGCGWLHSADDNPWVGLTEAAGGEVLRGPTPWTRPMLETVFPAQAQQDYRAAAATFYARLEAGAGEEADRPISAFLDPASPWTGLLSAISTYVSGAEPDRVSARDLRAYRDTGENWRVAGGYGAAIAAAGALLPVTLSCPATRIDHSGRRVRVETPQGAIEARAAILCLPSALLAQGAVAFSPELPHKRDAAAGLPLGLADKLYLGLRDAEEFAPETRVFGRLDRTATAAYHIRPLGAPVVEAYFGGLCAAELERGGAAAFADFAWGELAGMFGADFAKRLTPLPMHLWAADPFARGSYSYAAPGRAEDRAILAAPVDGRLFFAGEACSEHDFSTAHGAYRTGVAAAEAALSAIGRAALGQAS